MKEYRISRDGEDVRRVGLPDNEDVTAQLMDGETADLIDLEEPLPGSVLQP